MAAVLIGEGRHSTGAVGWVVRSVLTALEGAGGGEYLDLSGLEIRHCRFCRDHSSPCVQDGRCALEDDLCVVLEKLRAADAAIFVTRVYIPDFCEKLRAVLDRLQRICRHPSNREICHGMPAMGVCIGGGASLCAGLLSQQLAECGFDVCGVIPLGTRELHLKSDLLRDTAQRLGSRIVHG